MRILDVDDECRYAELAAPGLQAARSAVAIDLTGETTDWKSSPVPLQ
jgi:hypothetical protein